MWFSCSWGNACLACINLGLDLQRHTNSMPIILAFRSGGRRIRRSLKSSSAKSRVQDHPGLNEIHPRKEKQQKTKLRTEISYLGFRDMYEVSTPRRLVFNQMTWVEGIEKSSPWEKNKECHQYWPTAYILDSQPDLIGLKVVYHHNKFYFGWSTKCHSLSFNQRLVRNKRWKTKLKSNSWTQCFRLNVYLITTESRYVIFRNVCTVYSL